MLEYKPGETPRLRALDGVTRALILLIPVMAKTLRDMLFPFPYMAVALYVTSLAPLHTIFAIPHKLRTVSVVVSYFFAACTVSLFTCWGHEVSPSFIFAVSLPILCRNLQSLPRAPLGAGFLFFVFEKEAMQGANIICSTKLLFKTDVRKGNVML